MRHDGVVGFEDAVGEPVGAEILPDVLDGVEFGSARGQEDRRDVLRHIEVACGVPSGAVEQQNGVGALCDMARDFEVELHRLGVGVGQGERRPDSAGWANGTEQVGVVVALVGGLPWPRSASPTAAPGRSSARCGPHPYMRVPLSSPT